MRAIELTESVGLANRKEGQQFTNEAGETLTFKTLTFFPVEGQFDSPDERDNAIEEQRASLQDEDGVEEIEWTNEPSGRFLAFGLCKFSDDDGKTRVFGRYFNKISKIRTQNNWPNNTLPDGFKFASAASSKSRSGLMPQDVLTGMEDLLPENIVTDIENKFGADSGLAEAAHHVMNGIGFPIVIPNPDKSLEVTAVRDYFCEMIHPIALIKGVYTGNAGDAARKYLGADGFESCNISFSSGKNEGLFDSLLIAPDGKKIKVSSKGGMGATASVTNIYNSIIDLVSLIGKKPFEKYRQDLEVIRIIAENGQVDGPLKLAEYYGLLNEKETDQCRMLAKTQDPTTLTGRMKAMYNATPETEKTVPFYKMLATVAFLVSGYVNKNTNFGSAVSFVLNNDALVQVYTEAKQSGDNIEITNFKTVFPAELATGVELSAQKTYYSSGCKGKLTFKIHKSK
jgi:hypothetical protein